MVMCDGLSDKASIGSSEIQIKSENDLEWIYPNLDF